MKLAMSVALVAVMLVGCADRRSSIGSTIAGSLALAGGITLAATDDTPECMQHPHCPWFPSGRTLGAAGLIVAGTILFIAGIAGWADANANADAAKPPAPAPAPAPVPEPR